MANPKDFWTGDESPHTYVRRQAIEITAKIDRLLSFPLASMTSEPQLTAPTAAPLRKSENFWLETAKVVGLSVTLAMGMRQFVAEARFIPTGSMEPTLQLDDRVMVEKISYRFHTPQRGDIIVFEPNDVLKAENFKDALIKRVIGLPGDQVTVLNDQVTINGQALAENYPSGQHADEMTKIYEEQHRRNSKVSLWSPKSRGPNYEGMVPAGHYLVLGDHRSGSSDSRDWGFVPQDRIVGKAIVRFWPLRRMGNIDPQPSYVK
jgi:signal peptidase I